MVSGQAIGFGGVGLGTVLIILGQGDAGFGLLILGILGYAVVEIWTAGSDRGDPR